MAFKDAVKKAKGGKEMLDEGSDSFKEDMAPKGKGKPAPKGKKGGFASAVKNAKKKCKGKKC